MLGTFRLILEPNSQHAVLHLLRVLTMCSLHFRTQPGTLSEHQIDEVYDTPALTHYEDVSKTDMGGASNHTYTPAMKLSQCPAYASTEVSTGRGRRGDVGEEGIYEN